MVKHIISNMLLRGCLKKWVHFNLRQSDGSSCAAAIRLPQIKMHPKKFIKWFDKNG